MARPRPRRGGERECERECERELDALILIGDSFLLLMSDEI